MNARSTPDLSPVVKCVVVKCSAEAAFRYFTADFDKWWPGHTHSVIAMSSGRAKRPVSCVMDARPGGLIVEHGPADERHVWGTIVTWDPPRRVGFTWHPGYGPELAQSVEVTFTPVDGGTEVVLTHSGWDRLAERAVAARESYDNGWESVFVRGYRDYVHERR